MRFPFYNATHILRMLLVLPFIILIGGIAVQVCREISAFWLSTELRKDGSKFTNKVFNKVSFFETL